MSPKIRRNFAILLLAASLIGWPISMFTFAASEPPWILSLSWLAIVLTAADLWATTDVRATEESDDK